MVLWPMYFIDSDQNIQGRGGVHSNEPSGVEDHGPTQNGLFKNKEGQLVINIYERSLHVQIGPIENQIRRL